MFNFVSSISFVFIYFTLFVMFASAAGLQTDTERKITVEEQDELRIYCEAEDTVYYAYYIGKDGKKNVAGYCCHINFDKYAKLTFKNDSKVTHYNIEGYVTRAKAIKGYRTKNDGEKCTWRGPGVVCATKVYALPTAYSDNWFTKILVKLNILPESFLAASNQDKGAGCAELKPTSKSGSGTSGGDKIDISKISEEDIQRRVEVNASDWGLGADPDSYAYKPADTNPGGQADTGLPRSPSVPSEPPPVQRPNPDPQPKPVNEGRSITPRSNLKDDKLIKEDTETPDYDLRNPLERDRYLKDLYKSEASDGSYYDTNADRHPAGFSSGNIYIVPIVINDNKDSAQRRADYNAYNRVVAKEEENLLVKLKNAADKYLNELAKRAVPGVVVVRVNNNQKEFRDILRDENTYAAINSKYPDYLQNLSALEREAALFTAYRALEIAKYKATLMKATTPCAENQYVSHCVLEKIKKAKEFQDRYFKEQIESTSLSTSTKMEILKLYFENQSFENLKTPFARYIKEQLEASKYNAILSQEAKETLQNKQSSNTASDKKESAEDKEKKSLWSRIVDGLRNLFKF